MGLRAFTFIIIAIIFMVLSQRWLFFSKIRFVLDAVVTPIQYIVDWPFELMGTIASNLSAHNSLVEENASLKVQQLLLKSQLQKLSAIEKENNKIRALVASTPKSSTKVAVARVLAVASDPYAQEVVINSGSQQGIYAGQPVLDAQGVMGQVIQVGPWTSRVMLISDTRSGIPVNIMRNGIRAIAVGDGDHNRLRLINMPVTTDIKKGDELVSSGLGMRYPVGYPVGVVTNISHTKGAPYLDVLIKPMAYLNRSQLVLLIWSRKDKLSTVVKKQIRAMQAQNIQEKPGGANA